MVELRIGYASLLGWSSGLVVAMLDQISAACDKSGPSRAEIGNDEGLTLAGSSGPLLRAPRAAGGGEDH
jgi:hypothetical protein